MGASGSKECNGVNEIRGQSSDSDLNVRKQVRNKFKGSTVFGFGSSCIRLTCRSDDSVDSIQIPRHWNKEKSYGTRFVGKKNENTRCGRKFGNGDWAESRVPSISDDCNQSVNHSRSLLSRFNIFPSSLSFRMGRETDAGSMRDNNSPIEFPISREDGEIREDNDSSAVGINGCVNASELDSYGNRRVNESMCGIAVNDRARNEITVPNNYVNLDIIPPQHAERRNGNREPNDQNVQFSRSLSVGRLRDRVLQRSSASEPTVLPLRQDESNDADRSSSPSRGNNNNPPAAIFISPRSNARSGIATAPDHLAESSLPIETRYPDVLEHRSNFLERRRRIRSQVRALQRLGNRFENLSGHERSCIISGHHRTGHCTCRAGTRVGNSNDDSTARGSISRIVMLAEALFEVLDEMHQQSVLSSQPSISSIGSVPAPCEVVESLPIKSHSKLQMHLSDDVAQCYVCLLEYEEGDKIRVLPCHHEFHKTCIDKWLKEIHRVCPLCRGDICRSGTSHLESQIS